MLSGPLKPDHLVHLGHWLQLLIFLCAPRRAFIRGRSTIHVKIYFYLLSMPFEELCVAGLSGKPWYVANTFAAKTARIGSIRSFGWSAVTVHAVRVFEERSIHRVDFSVLPASTLPSWRHQMHFWNINFILNILLSLFVFSARLVNFGGNDFAWCHILCSCGSCGCRQLLVSTSVIIISTSFGNWGAFPIHLLVSTCLKPFTLIFKHVLLPVHLN